MKKALLITTVSAACLFLLQACGGDGDDTSIPPSTTPSGNTGTGGNTGGNGTGTGTGTSSHDQGSISAPFARGDASRYFLVNLGSFNGGALSNSVQAADGAMTTINSNQLSGNYSVQNIAGDASFAIGRWVKGTVTTDNGTDTLTGTDGNAYHYIAYQGLSAYPDTLTLHCTGGNFTTPTYSGGSNGASTGTSASGTADITFSGGESTVDGTLTVNANGETATLNLPKSLPNTPTGSSFSGGLGVSPSVGVQLADAGNGTYALMILEYSAAMPSGATYVGVGRLACTSN